MTRFLVTLLFCPFCLLAQVESNEVSDFLKRSSLKTDSTLIIESINQFLDADYKKGNLSWLDGKLLTNSDQQLDGLKLNLNAFNNSVYALHEGVVYKISNSKIKEFELKRRGKWCLFKKGYGIPFKASIVAKSNASVQEIMQYFTEYSELENLSIKEVHLSKDDELELSIQFNAGFRDDVSSIKRYLKNHESVIDVISEYSDPEVGTNIYLEVLYHNQYFEVIKYNFKRSSVSETVGIVSSKSQFIFDDEDYYFASPEKLLTPFFFGKSSIRKALASLGLEPDKKVTGIGSEKKMVKWCAGSRFTPIESE